MMQAPAPAPLEEVVGGRAEGEETATGVVASRGSSERTAPRRRGVARGEGGVVSPHTAQRTAPRMKEILPVELPAAPHESVVMEEEKVEKWDQPKERREGVVGVKPELHLPTVQRYRELEPE